MNYHQACNVLNNASKLGSKLGLEHIARLCELLGNPQENLSFIHIAGTNGKGSTSVMIAAILQAAGHKTAVYLSPYLEDYRDSFLIDRDKISKNDFANVVWAVNEQVKRMNQEGFYATEFEILTACAFLWFRQNKCDVVVLETGMGGRLDATNIVENTLVSVLTSITLDHTAFLGDTITKITQEKCGIIKRNQTTVCYPVQKPSAMQVIQNSAETKNNALIIPDMTQLEVMHSDLEGTHFQYRGEQLHVSLAGRHQALNAITAIETVRALVDHHGCLISSSAIKEGINQAYLPSRQELLNGCPLVILDGAHNLQGIQALADSITSQLNGRYIIVVMGMLGDKQYGQSIEIMGGLCDRLIVVAPDNPRAWDMKEAAALASKYCSDTAVYHDPTDGIEAAIGSCPKDGAVVICGSLYLVGKVRETIKQNLCVANKPMC